MLRQARAVLMQSSIKWKEAVNATISRQVAPVQTGLPTGPANLPYSPDSLAISPYHKGAQFQIVYQTAGCY